MEVFRAVMLTGSINGAAKLLFTSQPAISRIVSHTEKTLSLALFDRVKGKLVPTPEAHALFAQVEGFYQKAVEVDEFASGLAQGASGTLNVCCSPCLSRGLMARAIAEFHATYPKIRINIRTTLLNNMPQELLSNQVDLAISVLPLEHPNLSVEHFAAGEMVCLVRDDHALAARETVSIASLNEFPLIGHHPSVPFGQLVSAAFRKAGVPFQPHVDIYQTDVACSLVRAGIGIALVDQFTLDGLDLSGLRILPLTEKISLTPSIVRSRLSIRQGHGDKMIEVLRRLQAPEPSARRTGRAGGKAGEKAGDRETRRARAPV
jgi:DNA-binding transcriptional LysR family regulator